VTGPAPTIAVVDDDISVRRGLDRLLRARGYRVLAFASAADFLVAAGTESIACVVLDVRMPGTSGFDLQEALRVTDRRIPIVFISGHADDAAAVRAMAGGAVDFLAKPFDDQNLFDAVSRAIAGARGSAD
jgi:FixJ family two-component response regulator